MALTAVRRILSEMALLHSELSLAPADADLEAKLAALLEERHQLSRDLGRIAVRSVARGASVVVEGMQQGPEKTASRTSDHAAPGAVSKGG